MTKCRECDHFLVCKYADNETEECSQYKSYNRANKVEKENEVLKECIVRMALGRYGVQKWIPVTERLPDNKEHDWVLAQVVEDNGYMHIPKVMEYRQALNDWYEETYGWLSKHNGAFSVTHWMPLPEPPKGE